MDHGYDVVRSDDVIQGAHVFFCVGDGEKDARRPDVEPKTKKLPSKIASRWRSRR